MMLRTYITRPTNVVRLIRCFSESFDFIKDELTRGIVKEAHDIVENEKAYPLLKRFNGKSFMFDSPPDIEQLMGKIDSRSKFGHSGFSLGFTMRQLEYIAKNGMEEYKKTHQQE